MNMNFDQARFNMVEQQIRPWEVLDSRVLSLLEAIQNRRSQRDYNGEPITLEELAFILWATQGVSRILEAFTFINNELEK